MEADLREASRWDHEDCDAEIARLRKALVWAARNPQMTLAITAMNVDAAAIEDASLIETLCKLAEGE